MSDVSDVPIPSTARRALGGMVWSGAGLGAQGFGQFLVVIVLARELTRAENGVVAAALVVVALGQLFTEAGVGPAVVQREHLTDEHVRSAFALSVIAGVFMTAVVWFAAPWAADFFDQPRLQGVMRGLAFVFTIQGPGVIAMAMLQRDLDFKSIALAETVSYCAGFAGVGVVLAISGAGLASIVIAQLVQAAMLTGMLMYRRSHPRSLRPRATESKDLLVYAGGMAAARSFNFAALYGDYAIVGNRMTAGALGAYKNAYQLAAVPAQLLGQLVDRVIFPVIARFQTDLARVGTAYLRGVSLVAMMTIPASVLAVLLGPELIHLLLGGDGKWDDAIVPFQIFSAGLVFRTSYKISDSLARAMGTVYQRAWRQAVYALAVVVGALVGSAYGLAWVAVCVTAAIVLNYLLMAQLSLRTAELTWWRFMVRQGRGLVFAALVAAASIPTVLGLRAAYAGTVVTIIGGVVSAVVVMGLAWRVFPGATMGEDGRWLLHIVRSGGSSAPVEPESARRRTA